MYKKIVVCPDSFKGSLDSDQITEVIVNEINRIFPEVEVVGIPLADGGEGTTQIVSKFYPEVIEIEACDALLRKKTSRFLVSEDKEKAFIESADTLGLPLLNPNERNPLNTSSIGLGMVIRSAIERGIKEITVSLGGSATTDGGIGMLRALGWKFFDNTMKELEGRGRDTGLINSIQDTRKYPEFKNIKFNVICDVSNPLLGEMGAAKIFSPQKGASPADVDFLEEGLKNFSRVSISHGFGSAQDINKEGAGAAGGLGFAFSSFLKADFFRGIDFVLDILKFDKEINGSDLIVTGEGKLDSQSLMGKVVSGVLDRGTLYNIPVVCMAGKIENKDLLKQAGLKFMIEISDPDCSLEENMNPNKTKENIEKAVKVLFSNLIP